MEIRKAIWATLATASILTMQGCGGGGGSDSPPPEGLWNGTASIQGVTLNLSVLVLDDGTYYGLYGTQQGSFGMFQGKGSASDGKFASGNGRDYAFGSGEAENFTLNATFNPKASLSGTVTYSAPSGMSASFSTSYDTGYDTAVPLASLAGTYSGSVGTLEGVSTIDMTIDASGNYSSVTSDGCRVTGAFTPRGTTAVFNVSITSDAATCGSSISTTGIGGLVGGDGGNLVFVATTSNRSDAVFGTLTRP